MSPDLECMNSCSSPLVIENEVECNSPCESLNDFYVEATAECVSSCDSPNTQSTHEFIKMCRYESAATEEEGEEEEELMLSESDKEYIENIANAQTGITKTGKITAAISTVTSSIGASAFGIVIFNKFLYYVRYIDAGYPGKVLYYYKHHDSPGFSLGYSIPGSFDDQLPKHNISENFERYDLHSNFLVNFWPTFTTVLTIFGIALLVTGI